jgi:hypothetical protein
MDARIKSAHDGIKSRRALGGTRYSFASEMSGAWGTFMPTTW